MLGMPTGEHKEAVPIMMPIPAKLATLAAKCLRLSRLALITLLAICIGTVLLQDIFIFPLAGTDRGSPPPAGIEALSLPSADGSTVWVWRLRAKTKKPRAALLLHGNGTTVSQAQYLQQWLAGLGISTYSMEYRGYRGFGSGWPSERGLYEDATATFHAMIQDEGISAAESLVIGISIGTGIASHVAAQEHPRALVLISPYTSLTELVRERPLSGYLTPFLWYRFPSRDNIARLKKTCVVAAHGRRDSIISFHHAELLREAYTGAGTFTLLESPNAGHSSILAAVEGQLADAIHRCFRS